MPPLYNQHNLNIAKIAENANGTHRALQGVFFTNDCTIATDSFRLLKCTTVADAKPEDYPKTSDGKSAMRGIRSSIIAAEDVRRVKLPKKTNVPALEYAAISWNDAQNVKMLYAPNGGLPLQEIVMQKIDDKYPDVGALMQQKAVQKPLARVAVNAKYLREVLEIMEKMDSAGKVTMTLYGDTAPICLEASNEKQVMTGIVMPLRG